MVSLALPDTWRSVLTTSFSSIRQYNTDSERHLASHCLSAGGSELCEASVVTKVALTWTRWPRTGCEMVVRATMIALLAMLGTASLCSAQSSSLPLVTDLTGKGWTVQNTNGSITLDTAVPGYALEALVNAGKAPNPLAR